MGVLSDRQLRDLNCIHPFEEGLKRENVISYGVTSYGYDVRAGYIFDVFDQTFEPDQPVDPKAFNKNMLRRVDLRPRECVWYKDSRNKGMRTKETLYICDCCKDQISQVQPLEPEIANRPCTAREQPRNYVVIPPNCFALTETIETFTVPRDVLVVALGKSTYARCGLVLNVTPGEPEWEGKWTIELSNTSPRAIKVYAGEGIGQMIFLRADEVCQVSYADKKGKYQSQVGLTYPTVDKGV